MKRVMILAGVLALAAPLVAQQTMGTGAAAVRGGGQAGQSSYTAPKNDAIPPADPYVADVLKTSPRHGEWIDVKLADGKMMKSWISYPERAGKAPVVIVIFEIFGMNPWVQGVADQLAKDGFIAIAPDLLSGFGPNGGGSDELGSAGVRTAISTSLTPEVRAARLDAVMTYGKSIPSSNGKTGVVGFCWGGGSSLLYAIAQPSLNAAVMYYGPAPTLPGSAAPDLSGLPKIKAPILAFYPSTDNRTLATAQPIKTEMDHLGKSFEFHVYDGATHGFMHQRSEADYKAATESWPLAIQFFKTHLK